jgi:hypothetical protein
MLIGFVLAPTPALQAVEVHSVKLTHSMAVAGVDLRPAVYDVQWELHGTHATVTFLRKGRTVATVQGECATFDRSVPTNTFYFWKHPDGALAIYALGFASSNKGVVFPVVQSRRNSFNKAPLESPLMEQNWPDRTPPVPRVYR